MSKSFTYILLSLIVLSICSCDDEADELRKKQWVEREVYQKIIAFKNQKKEECINDILRAAEIEVDSLLAQKDLFGNVLDQEIPDKPVKPDFVPLDTVSLNDHKVSRD